jgi:low affinity Fe/Cu permease
MILLTADRMVMQKSNDLLPSSVTPDVGFFDRFADRATTFVSKAPYFTACVILVVLWMGSWFVIQDFNVWNFLINTATTIVTFLMVALLENSTKRDSQATQHKLNAIIMALADFMEQQDVDDQDVAELRAAIGLEKRESAE